MTYISQGYKIGDPNLSNDYNILGVINNGSILDIFYIKTRSTYRVNNELSITKKNHDQIYMLDI